MGWVLMQSFTKTCAAIVIMYGCVNTFVDKISVISELSFLTWTSVIAGVAFQGKHENKFVTTF